MEITKAKQKIKTEEASKNRLISEIKTCQKLKTMLSIAEGRINLIPSSLNMFNCGLELDVNLGTHKTELLKHLNRISEKLENYSYIIERLIIEE